MSKYSLSTYYLQLPCSGARSGLSPVPLIPNFIRIWFAFIFIASCAIHIHRHRHRYFYP